MNRGNARQITGALGAAIEDYDAAIALAETLVLRYLPTVPPNFVEVLLRGLFGRAKVREATGDAAGAASDHARLEEWRARLAVPADPDAPLTAPVPAALLPGEVGGVAADHLGQLGEACLATMDAEQRRMRPTIVDGGVQPLGADAASGVLVTLLASGPRYVPGAIDVLLLADGAIMLTPGLTLTEVSEQVGAVHAETSLQRCALALAGPWADPPRRLLGSAAEIPWCGPPRPLPAIAPPEVASDDDMFRVSGFWLIGLDLAQGVVRLAATGEATIVEELIVAAGLETWTWRYEGPFRVAVQPATTLG
jgi:hypothetical protein